MAPRATAPAAPARWPGSAGNLQFWVLPRERGANRALRFFTVKPRNAGSPSASAREPCQQLRGPRRRTHGRSRRQARSGAGGRAGVRKQASCSPPAGERPWWWMYMDQKYRTPGSGLEPPNFEESVVDPTGADSAPRPVSPIRHAGPGPGNNRTGCNVFGGNRPSNSLCALPRSRPEMKRRERHSRPAVSRLEPGCHGRRRKAAAARRRTGPHKAPWRVVPRNPGRPNGPPPSAPIRAPVEKSASNPFPRRPWFAAAASRRWAIFSSRVPAAARDLPHPTPLKWWSCCAQRGAAARIELSNLERSWPRQQGAANPQT